MKPIAVFYHARLSGGNPPVDEPYVLNIVEEQLSTMFRCRLINAAEKFYRCLYERDDPRNSEIPTLKRIQRWLPGHENWYVCYFHAKGSRNREPQISPAWRACMEKAVLWNWRACITALDAGYDTVGAHWLTRERYGPNFRMPFKHAIGCPIWGGNFWWATARYLSTLRELPETWRGEIDNGWPEDWIGSSPKPPLAFDMAPHWPNIPDCSKAL